MGAGWMLRLYPYRFRTEYGDEMSRSYLDLRLEPRHSGVSGALRFFLAMGADVVRSAPREWWSAVRTGDAFGGYDERPAYGAALLAALGVWLLYVATLAPTVAFWDAGEYITVAHIIGIPHPPGNPLFVVLARAWEILLRPFGLPIAVGTNLFSATLSAGAHFFWFLIIERVLRTWSPERSTRFIAAGAAVLVSATAFTVWNQSNVNEKVYTVSLFTSALVMWLAVRWRDLRDPKLLLLAVYILALTSTNHLMGVLAAPALLLFVAMTDRRPLRDARLVGLSLAAVVVALSVQLFLPLRAEQRPLVAEGDPSCESFVSAVQSIYTMGGAGCESLGAVLKREQYAKPSLLHDPTILHAEMPRSPSLLAQQVVNWLQYLDWQWARSVSGEDPLFGGIRPLITLIFVAFGWYGMRLLWRADRTFGAAIVLLFLTLSAGLVVYLNFKYGYSILVARFPDAQMHEVRERDYFFLIGFSVWGLFAGLGIAHAWRSTAEWLRGRSIRPALLAAPVLATALLPLALNLSWATRADDWTARDWAYNVLMSVEPYGVLVTNGDNDSFPLWYLQNVERVREDVTILLSPYLNTSWYLKQMREQARPCPPDVTADSDPTVGVCQRQFRPERYPLPLAANLDGPVDAPLDTVIPLSDQEIDRIVAGAFQVDAPLEFRAAGLRTTIASGTVMLPADTFVAAIVQATLGQRPIHFMTPSSHVQKLGLRPYTVRQGLTWRIATHPAPEPGWVRTGDTPIGQIAGEWVDVARTDTLLQQVFELRGRVTDENAPWVDAATISIPLQYAYAHYSAAQAHALRGDEAAARRHATRAEWWAQLTSD